MMDQMCSIFGKFRNQKELDGKRTTKKRKYYITNSNNVHK